MNKQLYAMGPEYYELDSTVGLQHYFNQETKKLLEFYFYKSVRETYEII